MLLNNPMLNPVHTHDANYFPPAPPMSNVSEHVRAIADEAAYKLYHQRQLRRARLPIQSRELQQPPGPELGLRQGQYSLGVKLSGHISPHIGRSPLGFAQYALLSQNNCVSLYTFRSVAITNVYLVTNKSSRNAACDRSPRPDLPLTPLLDLCAIAMFKSKYIKSRLSIGGPHLRLASRQPWDVSGCLEWTHGRLA